MKLYYSKGACSLAVRILIHEIGLSFEYESVDLKNKKTESGADYYMINVKGAVPAIQLDNGQVLTENAVIHQYLADINKATTLLPPVGDFQRYRVLEWLNYVTTELHKSIGQLFNSSIPQPVKNEVLIPLIKKKFDYLNNHLEKNKYLMGDEYTCPDGYLCVMLLWMASFKLDIGQWPNVARYYTDLKKRKSVQQAFKEENLPLHA